MTSLRLLNSRFEHSANSLAHRTNHFSTKAHVVRRGQPFNVLLTFNSAFQPTDSLSLTAETGPFPSVATNTKAVMAITTSSSGTSWSAVSKSMNNPLMVILSSPVNAVIGRYRLSLYVTSGGKTTYNRLDDFIMLFNPWVSGDEVYMSNEDEKREYVLNETGLIFIGNAQYRQSRYWDYGQFEDDVLDITLSLLDKNSNYKKNSAKDVSLRHDPVYVGRVLSAMVNSNDDHGVVFGNWSADYSGGTEPTQWNGSVPILRQWSKAGPVKYGQCWVYAGVLCTVLRCLGIPARAVSNFESAHDTDGNLTVDRYVDSDGRETSDTEDSVWNFHVWNEGWFVRKSIGSSYDGWQVLDATPQEQSEGLYCLGPCSLNAVKEGDVDLQFDTAFVFAEVNADIVNWMVYPDGSARKVYSNTRSIGQFTSTKAVGSNKRVDVTNNYKYPEGSGKERDIFEKAQEKLKDSSVSTRPHGPTSGPGEDLVRHTGSAPIPDFSATFNQGPETQVGQDVLLSLNLKNKYASSKNISIKMTATGIVYTRAAVKEILTDAQSATLEPHEEKNIQLSISYSQYKDTLTTDNMIKVVAVCVDDAGLIFVTRTVITLKSPPIHIEVIDEAYVNKPLHVEITFFNPLSESVDDVVLTIDGSGLIKQQIKIDVLPVQSNEKSITKLDIKPYKSGQRNLLVDLSCNKFFDIKGFVLVNVSSD